MIRWHYTSLQSHHGDFDGRLAQLGAEGWELVAIDIRGVFWFKRPIQ